MLFITPHQRMQARILLHSTLMKQNIFLFIKPKDPCFLSVHFEDINIILSVEYPEHQL